MGLIGVKQCCIMPCVLGKVCFQLIDCLSPSELMVAAGKLLSRTSLVPSHPQSYDADLASRLWNSSAVRCQLPADPRL